MPESRLEPHYPPSAPVRLILRRMFKPGLAEPQEDPERPDRWLIPCPMHHDLTAAVEQDSTGDAWVTGCDHGCTGEEIRAWIGSQLPEDMEAREDFEWRTHPWVHPRERARVRQDRDRRLRDARDPFEPARPVGGGRLGDTPEEVAEAIREMLEPLRGGASPRYRCPVPGHELAAGYSASGGNPDPHRRDKGIAVDIGERGGVVMFCHGCGARGAEILEALGYTAGDLYPPQSGPETAPNGPETAEEPAAEETATSGPETAQEGAEWAGMGTWAPVDMHPITSGTFTRPTPEIGARSDGVPVLYPGKEHVVASEPESGKTWLLCLLVVQVLDTGGRVVFVDFEDDALTIGARLLDLGADPEALNDWQRYRYVSPAEPVTAKIWARLLDFRGEPPTLVILDGTTEGYSLHGWEVNSQEDAAKWRQGFIRPALRVGAATLATDHVVKDREKRNGFAIGGQHKKAGLTGALFELVNVAPFGDGMRGRSRLLIHKDRPGGLRRHGVPLEDQPRVTHFADLVLAADVVSLAPEGEAVLHCTLEPVERTVDDRPATDPEVELGYQILAVLREFGPHSGQRLEAAVPGKAARIRRAVERLYHLREVCRGYRGSKPTAWHLPSQCTDELHPERPAEEGSE